MDNNSEFICDVVRITAVRAHPGADRLELVTISLDDKTTFPSEIVNAKGGFQAGDKAIYVGPDSIVPISGPFAFLSERLDAKGKTEYRVRSAKIRGIYSPGLLVPLQPGSVYSPIGKSYAAALGVRNYESDAEQSPQATGAPGVSKVRAKDIYPVYSVLSLKKLPNLFQEGEIVSVTEKIHGTNFRFGYGGKRKFYFGTHRTNLSDPRGWFSRLWDYLHKREWRLNTKPYHGGAWQQVVDEFDLKNICKKESKYIFYGEIFGEGIQKGYTYGLPHKWMLVFDAYYPKEKRWLNRKERNLAAWNLGLQTVPELYVGPYLFSKVKELAEDDSNWTGIREGVVIESLGVSPTGGLAPNKTKGKWISERYHLSKDKQ